MAHQIEYFSRQARKAERQERRYATLGWVCGAVATLIAVVCLSGGLQWLANHGFSGRQWLAFTMSACLKSPPWPALSQPLKIARGVADVIAS